MHREAPTVLFLRHDELVHQPALDTLESIRRPDQA